MSKYKGKRVLVVGFGVSGAAIAKYMAKQGAKVMVTDNKQRTELQSSFDIIGDLKVEFELGKHNPATFKSAELIVLSPGVPPNTPPLGEARAAGIPITGEIDIAAQAIKEPIIAVTGSNGKTTTTTLIGEIFKADEKSVFVGGNIGRPLIDYVSEGERVDRVIAELSCFQLETTEKLVPSVAVFTNVNEDHLDRYGTLENYVNSKRQLLRLCDKNSYVVLNHDCPISSKFANETSAKVVWFSKKDPMTVGGEFAEHFVGCYLKAAEKQIVGRFTGKEEVYDISKLRLFGEHNRENLMAAICAARSVGVNPRAIQSVIESFKGVAHRIEFVRRKDGVYFFNDSKGTNVASVSKSLSAFSGNPVILIMGGKDKGSEYTPLVPYVQKYCKILILVGEAKEKINRALGDFAETFIVGTFEEAVLLSFQKSRNGDVILLSPGCASQDMFRNFEERGDYFKKLVNQL